MTNDLRQKITFDHLKRNAYLYIRQSTLKQVFENTESTKRQYALKERAIALGWPIERIVVIDSDLGQSGSSTVTREGFKRLVSEVGMGHAGIVIGLEVSRLARNSSDWHRLLEICALTKTLILDEDGIYDPCHFNDRLLLGLKGTMSEAELHVIRSRLTGGILAKARRGELRTPIPIGFVYNDSGKVILDPDKQIQKSIQLLFEAFRREGSALGTVKYFNRNKLKFPRKLQRGTSKGEIVWVALEHSRCLQILHNPRYAGAFFFGRIVTRKLADGTTKYEKLPREQWCSFIKDVHEDYICWEEYEENQRRLKENSRARGVDRIKSPPREGPALLQGLVICGICGSRMTVRYHTRKGKRVPAYICQKEGIRHAKKICQSIPGGNIDAAIGKLLIKSVSPLALEVALSVQDELRSRINESDRLRKQQVERTRYEADLARRRYMHVDPENRLVAETLEAEWNNRLKELEEAQQEYERKCKNDLITLNVQQRTEIMSLATNFPGLWNDAKTPDREKKRMVRLLIEDVTIIKNKEITMHIRFRGGALKSLTLPAPKKSWQQHMTNKNVVALIDQLLDKHTDSEIADILNKRGEVSGKGKIFKQRIVARIRRSYGLKSRYDRLRAKGLLTLNEVSNRLKVSPSTVKNWEKKNMFSSYRCNDKNECLYEWPGNWPVEDSKERALYRKSSEFTQQLANRTDEVQYEI
jgi:DNA invertase Pin-like site-specific DNA recombinase